MRFGLEDDAMSFSAQYRYVTKFIVVGFFLYRL
jgi:hypothetical protein